MKLLSRNMAPTFAVALLVLHLSLTICVLGRPQPGPQITESSHSANELQVPNVAARHTMITPLSLRLRILHFQLPALSRLPVSTLERRSLKGGGGRRGSGYVAGAGRSGGSGGPVSTTVIIVIVVTCVSVLIITVSFFVWRRHKKRKNPNWSFLDYFRRRKQPAADKLSADKDMGTTPSEAETHKSSVDASRLENTKSRKLASRDASQC